LSGGPDYKAAQASPGEVIERGLAIDTGKIGKVPKATKPAGPSKAKKAKIAALEQTLAQMDADHEVALEAIDDQIRQLQDERAAAEKQHKQDRAKEVEALKSERG